MPYIEVKTNAEFSKEKEVFLKAKIADILASSFPGKTENWLMLNFFYNCNMYFSGSDDPCIIFEIALFNKQPTQYYDKMTPAICELIEKECGIPGNRIYVKYTEIERWGWQGSNF